MNDNVNHPKHYTSHPSGVECITITEHMTFNAGNAMKYLWRAGLKCRGEGITVAGTSPAIKDGRQVTVANISTVEFEKHLEDLRKAAWYVNREIERLEKEAGSYGSN